MAVYTNVDDAALAEFLTAYDVGTVLSFAGIAEGVENSNYLLRTDRANYILTLYEKRVDRNDLPFFIEVMQVLAESGLNCPLPVPARDGSILQELQGRPCAVFSFLDGTWSRFPNRDKCAELGRALATMHLNCAPVTRRRPNALGPAAWQPLLDSIGSQADVVGDGMQAAIQQRLETILSSWPSGLPSGVIHADLFPNNVLFVGDELTGVIDFYFACHDLYAYDLAVCLNSWCFDSDGSFNITKSTALIKGYQTGRPLEADEIDSLAILCSGAAMRFFLTRLYDWIHTPADALVKPLNPLEYWQKLRIHEKAQSPQAYGIW